MKLEMMNMASVPWVEEFDELSMVLPGDHSGTITIAVRRNDTEYIFSDLEYVKVIKEQTT